VYLQNCIKSSTERGKGNKEMRKKVENEETGEKGRKITEVSSSSSF
jgi:hypothetical protein